MVEMALDLTVKGEQRSDGWEVTGAEILLSTGGPAVRIECRDAYAYGTLADPVLQCQDWFTPWTDVETSRDDDDALLWFISLFYVEG